ncbi:hypothetical protein RSSM_00745 [Rhodopirellula sallentina SM41]|uniref:Uncharacterized protein n=1 Tax=Rhodopirellula sallentina SM41 TaxID=1263870 RepID=M5UIX5_9BACT|nr:hypothetical protein RSSM_00745 [Rhodopirellula sallentina SM41]
MKEDPGAAFWSDDSHIARSHQENSQVSKAIPTKNRSENLAIESVGRRLPGLSRTNCDEIRPADAFSERS